MLRRVEEIPGLQLTEAKCFPDERGYLLQAYMVSELAARGITAGFRQAIESRSRQGVVRGLHFQWDPPMGKLVRCTHGRVFDVAVDLRVDSPTLGDHAVAELTSENRAVFWLPPGFAHGFMALEDRSIVHYECTAEWAPRKEAGVRWDDPEIGIRWPGIEPIVSPKDAQSMTLREWLSMPAASMFRLPAS